MKNITLRTATQAVLCFLLLAATPTAKAQFAKGADVGWLPQMEATGFKFYDADGKEKD